MKVFAHVYCPCIYESAEAVVSLHFTREGAEKAVAAAKQEEYQEWVKDQQLYRDNPEWGIKPETEYRECDYTYRNVKEMEIV